MSIPTMEELRERHAGEEGWTNEYAHFAFEVAFYHGFMAALDQIDCTNPLINDLVLELRDQMNADMAAEIGG